MQYTQIYESTWTFPHVMGGVHRPSRTSHALIDTYTASYMRWQSKTHVLAWLKSFKYQFALRPVFLDTETTGARRISEVIEICILDEDGRTLFHSLLNPTTEIEPLATAIHGLTRRHVAHAPRYPALHEEVMHHLLNRVVIAYNVSFDIRLLWQTTNRYDLVFPSLHAGCLMYAYAKYREVSVERSDGHRRYKTHRLEAAMAQEGLELPPFHRAERDAQCVHRLFQALMTQNE